MDTKWIIFLGYLYFVGIALTAVLSVLGLSSATAPTVGYVLSTEEGLKLAVTATGEVDTSLSTGYTSQDLVEIQGSLFDKAKALKDMVWSWIVMDYEVLDNPVGEIFKDIVRYPFWVYGSFLVISYLRRFIPFLP